jgi:hypothetical protein
MFIPSWRAKKRPRTTGTPWSELPFDENENERMILSTVNDAGHAAMTHLVGVAEIADMFRVSRQRVNAILESHDDIRSLKRSWWLGESGVVTT